MTMLATLMKFIYPTSEDWRKVKLFFRMVIRSYRVIVGTWHMKRLRHFENLIEKEWIASENTRLQSPAANAVQIE